MKQDTIIQTEELPEDDRHTEDMQEIITKVPSWVLRWGIMVFFGILLMVAAISVFVRYPDTIKAGLKLESTGITMPVIASAQGRITAVYVKQGNIVRLNQPLLAIETYDIGNKAYTLRALNDGKVGFVAIVQPGEVLRAGQEVFTIHPQNEQFFGLMEIQAANINKIRVGQQVLISLRNYPANEYGQLKGTISYVADEPGKEGFFAVKVSINYGGLNPQIALKAWMMADAEIITQDVSILKRVMANLFKGLK